MPTTAGYCQPEDGDAHGLGNKSMMKLLLAAVIGSSVELRRALLLLLLLPPPLPLPPSPPSPPLLSSESHLFTLTIARVLSVLQDEDHVKDHRNLDGLNAATLVENTKQRFKEDKIYTYISQLLIAVNPFHVIDGSTGQAEFKAAPHRTRGADACTSTAAIRTALYICRGAASQGRSP